MQTGVSMESYLSRLFPSILPLFLLIQLCLAAPGFTGTPGEESISVHAEAAAIVNPFSSEDEDRRIRQSFIQFSKANGQDGPETSTHEQEVFYLFGVFDFDHSGSLDGLELMKLVSEFNLHHTDVAQPAEQVVSLVDSLLQSQDLNQDGLLSPAELLSQPLPHTQDAVVDGAPQQEEELKESLSDHKTTEVQEEGAQEKLQPQNDGQPQEEEEAGEEINSRQILDAPAAGQGQDHHAVPVHQGQPEI